MEYTKESFFKHLDGCLFTRVNSSFKNWLINRGDLAYCIKYQENPTTYIEEEMLVFCEKEFDYDVNNPPPTPKLRGGGLLKLY